MHYFVPDYLENDKKIVLYNPHPYPVTVSELGHVLGGREKAVVSFYDLTVGKVIDSGLVMKLDEEVSPKPTSSTKKKK